MAMNPKFFDIFHGDAVDGAGRDIANFDEAFAAGYRGVVHKATQGTRGADPLYAQRRRHAVDAGLLWGAYAFNTGDEVSAQVQQFVDVAKPDADTLMALDFEDNRASEMSLDQAVEFLTRVDTVLDRIKPGKLCMIYSGNRMKALIVDADEATRAFLAKHPLWGAEFGPVFKNKDANGKELPWPKLFAHQFTGDGIGPKPHDVPGIQVSCDIDSYDGSDEQFAADWAR